MAAAGLKSGDEALMHDICTRMGEVEFSGWMMGSSRR
jgi:hypothetical protein